MKPYDKEFRSEVLAACDLGEGTKSVALRFDVSESWVRRIKQQRRETGQLEPQKAKPRQPKWRGWSEWLKGKIAECPDIYLRELKEALKKERNDNASLMTICNACRELGLTRKKRL